MPVHDWSRVRSGRFHHFHNSWIYKLSDRLNAGLLPPGFYAAGEQVAGGMEPDVLALEEQGSGMDRQDPAGAIALAHQPPKVAQTMQAEDAIYLAKQDRIAIRGTDGDRLVAIVEILSRGNKASRNEMNRFLKKVASCVEQNCHLLIVDLFPPGSFDPNAIHAAVWDYLFGWQPDATDDGPLTLVAYRVSTGVPTAYVQPTAVGRELAEMPLFLSNDWYVNVPLEETYQLTWEGLPEPWQREIAS